MRRIGRHSIRFTVDRSQCLAQQTLPHPLVADSYTVRAQHAHHPRTTIALPSSCVDRRHLCIKHRVGFAASAHWPLAPLLITPARYAQVSTQSRHRVIVAMLFNPGVSHRDSFAKYAAAFFTISRSNLAFASSRRSRSFSAWSSAAEPATGVARGDAVSLPLRFSRAQL